MHPSPVSSLEKKDYPTLATLPTELHLLVSSHLTYPDALSLKHTNRYFYYLVCTDVELKIEWLIERRTLHLDCPHDKKCELGSDTKFCRGSISLLMRRRREHVECDSGEGERGCLVFGTKVCTFQKKPDVGRVAKIKRLLSENALLSWIAIVFVGLLLAWTWMAFDAFQ